MLWSGLGSLTGANRLVCCVSPGKVLSYNYLLETWGSGEGEEEEGKEGEEGEGVEGEGEDRLVLALGVGSHCSWKSEVMWLPYLCHERLVVWTELCQNSPDKRFSKRNCTWRLYK